MRALDVTQLQSGSNVTHSIQVLSVCNGAPENIWPTLDRCKGASFHATVDTCWTSEAPGHVGPGISNASPASISDVIKALDHAPLLPTLEADSDTTFGFSKP